MITEEWKKEYDGKGKNTASVEQLFADWQETVIWSCLAGTMGDLYADDLEHPAARWRSWGIFVIWQGNQRKRLPPLNRTGMIRILSLWCPQNKAWGK